MNELHLFAGAGGGILGGMLLGHTCVCAVEWDKHARQVLLARQRDGCLPRFPIWDDVQTFDGNPWRGRVDIVCGGFPCQDISTAGGANRKGLAGKRSGLWAEMARICGEIRPRYIFVENSPALSFRGLGIVLGDLAEMGYDAKWGVVSAGDVGARHERERMWIVAYHRDADKDSAMSQRRLHEPSQESIRAMSEGISAAPRMGRKADGVAGWVDRLERLGNGQVPQVAALAFKLLSARLG
jgi:DNA (cytosine-5)-methyltransferase 1